MYTIHGALNHEIIAYVVVLKDGILLCYRDELIPQLSLCSFYVPCM